MTYQISNSPPDPYTSNCLWPSQTIATFILDLSKWVFWFIPIKIFPQVFLISTNSTTINPAAQAKSIGLVVDAFLPQTSTCIPFSKPYQYTSKQQLNPFTSLQLLWNHPVSNHFSAIVSASSLTLQFIIPVPKTLFF